jgi:hypothetical protein
VRFSVSFVEIWDSEQEIADELHALPLPDAADRLAYRRRPPRDPFMGRDDRTGTRPRDAAHVPFGVDYGLFDAGCARARAQFSLRCSRSTISGWLSRHGGVP